MPKRASMALQLPLPLMNSFNKTKATYLPHASNDF